MQTCPHCKGTTRGTMSVLNKIDNTVFHPICWCCSGKGRVPDWDFERLSALCKNNSVDDSIQMELQLD